MTRDEAIQAAKRKAIRRRIPVYVVYSVEETDTPGEHYHTATDADLDGFYMGCNPVIAVSPDGDVEA